MGTRTDDEIIEFSTRVPGYYDEDELRRLLALTRALPKSSTIVEIGVECGRSASIFLQCSDNWSTLYLIDDRSHNAPRGKRSVGQLLAIFQADDPDTVLRVPDWKPWTWYDPINPPNVRHRRPYKLGTHQRESNMIYDWERTSLDTASDWRGGEIDLLHIDADHGPAVWDDCRVWLPKVGVGGVVVFHDYARKGADPTTGDVFPEVTRAVDAHCSGPRFQPLGVINTQFAARRIA
jgi:predicted O-methyltransferase YrrM